MSFDFSTIRAQKAWSIPGLLVLVAVFIGLVNGPAGAQSNAERELQNRIQRLENEVQTLSRALYKGEAPPAGSFSGGGNPAVVADFEVRLQQFEGELRDARGKIEELSFQNRELKGELERVKGDLELRIRDLGGANGAASSGSSSYAPSDVPASGGAVGSSADGYQWSSENNASQGAADGQLGSYSQSSSGAVNPSADAAAALYDNAYALLKNKNYERAQAEFDQFLAEYPSHGLAGNAKYWLGETYYVRGKYDVAARIFAEGYQQYPDNSKTADNLLKLGMSLGALGKKDDACIALAQLDKETGANLASVQRRAEQEKTRLGC